MKMVEEAIVITRQDCPKYLKYGGKYVAITEFPSDIEFIVMEEDQKAGTSRNARGIIQEVKTPYEQGQTGYNISLGTALRGNWDNIVRTYEDTRD